MNEIEKAYNAGKKGVNLTDLNCTTHDGINAWKRGYVEFIHKSEKILLEVETTVTHRIECGHCEKTFESENEEAEDFVKKIVPDFHYAISKEYASQGWICDSCFNNEEEDWEEYNPNGEWYD